MGEKFNYSNNKYFQVNGVLGLHAQWVSFRGSTGLTLDSYCITLFANNLTDMITFRI